MHHEYIFYMPRAKDKQQHGAFIRMFYEICYDVIIMELYLSFSWIALECRKMTYKSFGLFPALQYNYTDT